MSIKRLVIAEIFHNVLRGHADEQAPRLAPEKRDFTATYTLGATT